MTKVLKAEEILLIDHKFAFISDSDKFWDFF